ncbi:MAG: pantetheine-phosphate adenylyltransferase [Acidobacteria bacterium]|jgi:pantetheine-phosphate adenylyltransferase|nr:pantetheine-phosphate adenylyltransferase [Acidobacteriota bacterium]
MGTSSAALAVYPGSFDPLHLGHVDIIDRALQIFPRVMVGILENAGKDALFSPAERVAMIRELFADQPAVEVQSFSGLLVKFLKELDATIIIRGMRAVSDFEYEFQMALMNRRLYPGAETVFLTPKEEFTYLSSRLVKEVVALGGDVTGLVPAPVRARLEARYRKATHPPTS